MAENTKIPQDGFCTESSEPLEPFLRRFEEGVPTLLYQKIGTVPGGISDQFILSSTNALKSYIVMKKELEQNPPKDKIRRQDGRMVWISWGDQSHPEVVRGQNGSEDCVILPVIPENSEWLIYEFPQQYEKASYMSFLDIGLVMYIKVLLFQKIGADRKDKIMKMKLTHPENKNSKTSIKLYLLPRVGNLVVLGPVKKDFIKSRKVTFPKTLSYIRRLHENNFFGSPQCWATSFSMNADKFLEPFSTYLERKKKEESDALIDRVVPPDVMDQIIPELMETYDSDELPASLSHVASLKRGNPMQLKWSDSIKCSANVHPRLKTVYAASQGRYSTSSLDLLDDPAEYSDFVESDHWAGVEEVSDNFSDASSYSHFIT